MQIKHWTLLSFGLVTIAATAHAVGCRTNGCNVDPDCDSTVQSDAGVGGNTPDSCIPKKNQEDNGTAVKDECGLFVRLAGDNDLGTGTKNKPFATISKAIEMAMMPEQTRRIYVCAEIFIDPIEVHSGIEIYGGLNCAGAAWSYSGKQRTTIEPAADLIPIRFIKDDDRKIHIEDVDARAADAIAPGGSSIAATADAVTLIELLRSDFIAGSGAPGADGVTPPIDPAKIPTDMQIAGTMGKTACQGGGSGNVGPPGATNPFCVVSIGGKGGTGQEALGEAGSNGAPFDNPNFGLGGAGSMGVGCQAGQKGAKGEDGMPGESAGKETDLGSFDLAGYKGVDGKFGGDAKPGQGGGGGGAAKGKVDCFGASGGSGGAGGCGGSGGSGGKAGGSSIALISLGATFVFEEVKLVAGSGGTGGSGADGQLGGISGKGGIGGPQGTGPAAGCAGGDGGEGGQGGKGGGGHGGHAVGIVWMGVPPPEPLPMGTISFGNAGFGGAGTDQDKGADGKAQEILPLP